MAEVVFSQLVREDPLLSNAVHVSSAATANWHVGKPMDPRARAALDQAGYDAAGSLGAFASSQLLHDLDLTIVMTREQRDEVRTRRGDCATPVILLRSLLEPKYDLDLADPYYGNAQSFDECLSDIIPVCRELARVLRLGGEQFVASLPAE